MAANSVSNRPPESDNRRHRRFTVDVEGTVITGDGRRIPARTRDVSQTGICLVSSQPILRGDLMVVSLVLAFAENTRSEPLELAARVVWCTQIGEAFQIGGMFEDVTEEQDGFLEMFLQFLDGTLAPRGVAAETESDDDYEESPDDKDNPFR